MVEKTSEAFIVVTIAATPPSVATGPPGWVVVGVLVAATAIVSAAEIMKADEEVDNVFADDEPTGIQKCPEDKTTPAETKDKPAELPKNPDDLLEDGYEETTHPDALADAEIFDATEVRESTSPTARQGIRLVMEYDNYDGADRKWLRVVIFTEEFSVIDPKRPS